MIGAGENVPTIRPALSTRTATLGVAWIDVRCETKGCPWHKVVHTATAGGRVLGDLRDHVLGHRTKVAR